MAQTHAITLTGSIEAVTEYFGFAVNNILYQRGIYPAACFQPVRKYGLPLMISTDRALNDYLANLLQQIALWMAQRQCRVVALLIVDPATDAVRERWEFTVVEEEEKGEEGDNTARRVEPLVSSLSRTAGGGRRKSEEEVRRHVQAVLRQITA
ncbi:mitotic spindle assembly checkpoint protein MAD2A-like, partial [Bactrocera neohumeralis]|uniref:mitotic spindle assembly checkpoint protein MAD2A-like n=1 Tax=Bactrocera neohumeralis TaxID=98809 RepID=UPI00216549D7